MSEHVNEPSIKFTRPESYVVSVRLNDKESKALTAEARLAGEKLSTFIKAAAIEAVARRRAEREQKTVSLGNSDHPMKVGMVLGLATEISHHQGSTLAYDKPIISYTWSPGAAVA